VSLKPPPSPATPVDIKARWMMYSRILSPTAPVIASIQELKKRNDDVEAENVALLQDFEAYKEVRPRNKGCFQTYEISWL
jgi:hypothetical protein